MTFISFIHFHLNLQLCKTQTLTLRFNLSEWLAGKHTVNPFAGSGRLCFSIGIRIFIIICVLVYFLCPSTEYRECTLLIMPFVT